MRIAAISGLITPVIASDAVRHPFAPLDEATRAGLLALAKPLEPLVLRWAFYVALILAVVNMGAPKQEPFIYFQF